MPTKPPLLNEKIYAPYKIQALVEVLAAQRIDATDSLRGTGIDAADLDDPHKLTSVRQYLAVCSNALRLSSDPATPFLVGSRMHLSAYGMYGYALLSSATMREFFDLGVKFHRLATPTLNIQWREDPNAAVWFFPQQFISAPTPELRRFLLEQQFAQHVTHMKDCVGAACVPIRALASYPVPEHAELYEQFLDCPVAFEQPTCELHYPLSVLDRSPQLSHTITSKILQETCDRLIGSSKTSTGIAGETYQILVRTPGQFPGMEEVADALHMTARTLRRKLEAEGTSFAEIFDDVRSTLATEYLQTTRMKTEDISALLGFGDPANFRHAFKRWTGKTPAECRRAPA